MSTHSMLQVDNNAVEYGSPNHIIEMAREVMGGIDLDPCSSSHWNEVVKATHIYTKDTITPYGKGALYLSWFGKVWMNHPFSRQGNALWIQKAVDEYQSGRVSQLINICYLSSSEKWIRPLLGYPICIIHGRTNYIGLDGTVKKGVQKGSCCFYLGSNKQKFKEVFSKIGTVYLG